MNILFPDTSTLFNLERGGLLEPFFSCGMTMVVHNILNLNELGSVNGPYLHSLGLGVVELDPVEMSFVQTIRAKCPSLSLSDCGALACALRSNHTLIFGCGNLHNEAKAHSVKAYDLIWLLDQMEASGNIPFTTLHEGLNKISTCNRCSLPREAVKTRLKKWAK